MIWIVWAATLSLLICGALVARIAESPEAEYWLWKGAGAVTLGFVIYWIVLLTAPVKEPENRV